MSKAEGNHRVNDRAQEKGCAAGRAARAYSGVHARSKGEGAGADLGTADGAAGAPWRAAHRTLGEREREAARGWSARA